MVVLSMVSLVSGDGLYIFSAYILILILPVMYVFKIITEFEIMRKLAILSYMKANK